MNKTYRCSSRLHTSIRLEYKNKFTIKKVLFQPIMNFPPKVFQSWFDPKSVYKTINKKLKKCQSAPGTFRERENGHILHFRQDQRLLTPDQSTSQTIKHCISNTRPRRLITYLPTSHYHSATNKWTKYQRTIYTQTPPDSNLVEEESLLKMTYTHSHPDLYLTEEESLYSFSILTFIYSKINEIKSISLVLCLWQPYTCQ